MWKSKKADFPFTISHFSFAIEETLCAETI